MNVSLRSSPEASRVLPGAGMLLHMRRVALVTGASRGVGRQTALVLASRGWDVAITARTLEEGAGLIPSRDGSALLQVEGSLSSTTEQLLAAGVQALPIMMDLLDPASVQSAAETLLSEWGRIDLLVNNAIVHLHGAHTRVLDTDLDITARMLQGNFLSQLALTQALLPAMVAQGGATIVNMASGAATTDPPAPPDEGGWSVAYAASKAAFGRVAGAINAEYRKHGIRCFNVDPGFVVTEAMLARRSAAAIRDKGFESADPQAAGKVIAWLAEDPDAEEYLGKVIWSPTLSRALKP